MTKNTVSIVLDRESLARFACLLGDRPFATGVHCSGDEDEVDVDGVVGRSCARVAVEAHCANNDNG